MTSSETRDLISRTVVWDNHSCMPMRPGDTSFLPQLERVRQSGISVISLCVSFDLIDPHEAFANASCGRSEEHTSELQSRFDLVCRLLLEKKKNRMLSI